MIYHFAAIFIAYLIDLLVGDPKHWPHPVKAFGKMINFFDQSWNYGKRRKFKGSFMVAILTIVTGVSSLVFVLLSYHIHPIIGVVVESILIATTIAQKSLQEADLEVYEPLKTGEIERSRKKLSYIVGRDTDHLEEAEIVRGTVETVAENTSDGITAPLFWAFIGGAPAALIYRVINTCDSMVGYQNEQYSEFGWASARFDDLLNVIPARLTALVMMFSVRPEQQTYQKAWSIVLRDARKHASPNSGWVEATVAALLNVQLGGVNFYQGVRSQAAKIGNLSSTANKLTKDHILRTIFIMKRTVILFIILMIVGGVLLGFTYTWIQSTIFI